MDKSTLRKLKSEKELLLDAFARLDMANLKNKRIMVIDDCVDTLKVIKKFLSQIDQVIVETFFDEYKAIARFMEEKPDLLIMDMNLMNLDGIKLSIIMDNISTFKIPVIFISSSKSAQIEIKNFYGNESKFIAKPVHRDHLITNVQSLLKVA